MKTFKIIDFWLSIVLIPGFVLFGFITMNEKFLFGYFIVGGWQVASMVIHWMNKWFMDTGWKRAYYQKFILILLAIIALLAALAQVAEELYMALLVIMFLLLILSPLMAIYYACICYEETFIKMKRPMELLK